MKKLTTIFLSVLLLCLCLQSVCLADPQPGDIFQSGDELCLPTDTAKGSLVAQWEPVPAPTKTPMPGKPVSGGKPGIPVTGDNTNLGLWVGILGGSAAVIAGAAVWNKRRGK